MIQDLFKTPIYTTALDIDNKSLSKYCISYSKKNKGRILSNEGGYQSEDLILLNHKILNPLVSGILEHSSIYCSEINLKCSNKIDNIWFNINGYKDSNLLHSHPHSLISGVYYLQTPKDCGNIQFHHPGSESFQNYWMENVGSEYNTYNSGEWWLQSIVGVMYLFPSWLKHYVRPNLNKKEKRISISFNIK